MFFEMDKTEMQLRYFNSSPETVVLYGSTTVQRKNKIWDDLKSKNDLCIS